MTGNSKCKYYYSFTNAASMSLVTSGTQIHIKNLVEQVRKYFCQ